MGTYDITELDAAYGRPEAIRRIREYRNQHSASMADAIEVLTRELTGPKRVTPEQVQTTIDVLKAFADGDTIDIDIDLRIALTDAIDLASYGPILCEIEDDPPVNLG